MRDSYGRKIEYLRISITDRCNLSCRYCMPSGRDSETDLLTRIEILRAVRAAACLGIKYIKVTGGEPLVRQDCVPLIRALKQIPGIEKVTLTTNGVLLADKLKALEDAGIDGINISLDGIDREKYRELTGRDAFDKVMKAIHLAGKSKIQTKINCVSIRGYTDWSRLVLLAEKFPVDVRFIEMMPLGLGKEFETMDNRELMEKIAEVYPEMVPDRRFHGPGPAVYYQIPGFKGSIGFINAIHGPFCSECNRIRMTSDGFLKTCLCYGGGVDLRPLLKNDCCQKALERLMAATIEKKPAAHCFDRPEQITESHWMGEIGG